MLVTSRRVGESIRIGDDVEVKIVDIRRNRVSVGITAPNTVRVKRVAAIEVGKENVSASDPPAKIVATLKDVRPGTICVTEGRVLR